MEHIPQWGWHTVVVLVAVDNSKCWKTWTFACMYLVRSLSAGVCACWRKVGLFHLYFIEQWQSKWKGKLLTFRCHDVPVAVQHCIRHHYEVGKAGHFCSICANLDLKLLLGWICLQLWAKYSKKKKTLESGFLHAYSLFKFQYHPPPPLHLIFIFPQPLTLWFKP